MWRFGYSKCAVPSRARIFAYVWVCVLWRYTRMCINMWTVTHTHTHTCVCVYQKWRMQVCLCTIRKHAHMKAPFCLLGYDRIVCVFISCITRRLCRIFIVLVTHIDTYVHASHIHTYIRACNTHTYIRACNTHRYIRACNTHIYIRACIISNVSRTHMQSKGALLVASGWPFPNAWIHPGKKPGITRLAFPCAVRHAV
jgi:hypothetical protein